MRPFMPSLFLASLAALCVPATFAQPSSDQGVRVWREKGWQVYLYRDADDVFKRCSTVVEYTSGRILSFSVDRSSKLIMRLGRRDGPAGQPGQSIPTYFAIDGMAPRAEVASVETEGNGFLSYDFGQDYSIFRNLRRGHVLALSSNLGDEKLSLAGSAQALRKMAECVPRPFSGSGRETRIKAEGNRILTSRLPKDLEAYGADVSNTVFDKNMATLQDALLGPEVPAEAPAAQDSLP